MRRIAAVCCALLIAGGVAWATGFAAFDRAARASQGPVPHADGIVVLTGGAERIETGIRLLTEGYAPRLLVSGVGGGTELAELTRHSPLPHALAAQVTLGRRATTTLGNAEETAAWAQEEGAHSLLVVTAGYHMARALLELKRAAPGITLYAVSVQPPALRHGVEMATMRMMANEYDKYLAARLGWTRRFGVP